MFTKRIIPCLDVKDGRVVKGVNFVDLRDAGDPVEIAAAEGENFLRLNFSTSDYTLKIPACHHIFTEFLPNPLQNKFINNYTYKRNFMQYLFVRSPCIFANL